jgi:hypothetical protein
MAGFPSPGSRESPLAGLLQCALLEMPNAPCLADIRAALSATVTVALAYERHQISPDTEIPLHRILMVRHCVLHDLLSIDDLRPLTGTNGTEVALPALEIIHDLAKLSALSFMVLDLHPVMRGHGPHEQLESRLRFTIKQASRTTLDTRLSKLYRCARNLHSRLVAEAPQP